MLSYLLATILILWLAFGFGVAIANEIDGSSQFWWEPIALLILGPAFFINEHFEQIKSFFFTIALILVPLIFFVLLNSIRQALK